MEFMKQDSNNSAKQLIDNFLGKYTFIAVDISKILNGNYTYEFILFINFVCTLCQCRYFNQGVEQDKKDQ